MRITKERNRWKVHYDGEGQDKAMYLDFLMAKNVKAWLKHNTKSRWAFCPSPVVESHEGSFSFGSEEDAILFNLKFSSYRTPDGFVSKVAGMFY